MTQDVLERTHGAAEAPRPHGMKAAVLRRFGGPEVLEYDAVERPTPGPGQALVKVLAAGVNRLDHYIRDGSVVPSLPFPHVLGTDAAGEIAGLGPAVTGLRIGDRVIPAPGYPRNEADAAIRPVVTAPSFALPGLHVHGTYAQYLTVPARWLVLDETGLPPEEVATLPVVLATSVRAVKAVGAVKDGDAVLVQSGGSGSGSMQIQVARALGARVAATVRGDAKGELARSMGAELVIDTRHEDFVQRVKEWTGGRGVDVVIDNLGGDVLPKSLDAVRPLGTVVAYGFVAGTEVRLDIRRFFFAQKILRGSMAGDPEDLEWGLAQVRAGTIRPVLDRVLPLSQAAQAHRLISTNQVRGNLVLLPWED